MKSNPSSFLKVYPIEDKESGIQFVNDSLESSSILPKSRIIPSSDIEEEDSNSLLQHLSNNSSEHDIDNQDEAIKNNNGSQDNSVISVISSDDDSVMLVDDESSQESDNMDEIDDSLEDIDYEHSSSISNEDCDHDCAFSHDHSDHSDNSTNSSDLDDSFDELGSIIRDSLYSNPKTNQIKNNGNDMLTIHSLSESDLDSNMSESNSTHVIIDNSSMNQHEKCISSSSLLDHSSSKFITMMNDEEYLQLAHTKLPYFQSIQELEIAGCPFRLYIFFHLFIAFGKMFKTSNRTKSIEDLQAAPPK